MGLASALRGLSARVVPGPQIVVAERFSADLAEIDGIVIPPGRIVARSTGYLDVVVRERRGGRVHRSTVLGPVGPDGLTIDFAPFGNGIGDEFDLVIALAADGHRTRRLLDVAADARAGERAPFALRQKSRRHPCGPVRYGFDHLWCDTNGIYLDGWLSWPGATIRRLRVTAADRSCDVAEFVPRPRATSPDERDAGAAGFRVYLPWRPSDILRFEVTPAAGLPVEFPVEIPGSGLVSSPWSHAAAPPAPSHVAGADLLHAAYQGMIDEANERNLSVVEIGSRNVSPHAVSKRSLFPHARSYLGVDVHAAPNVDVVGDAHFLDDLIGRSSADLVFSIAVLEHLAYPWLFAAAVNRALRPGGLTFHATHQAWPLHEEPNDFWRFSDQSMRVLFGEDLGFDIVHAGMHNPVRMMSSVRTPAYAEMPLATGFAGTFVLARKVREIGPGSVSWPISAGISGDRAKAYPNRT